MTSELTPDKLREVLSYCPETGTFLWKVRTAHRSKVGDVAGSLNGQGYRYIKLLGRGYRANRLAWLYVNGEWPKDQVDHINGDRGDDRISNLRDCSNAQNAQNRNAPQGCYKTKKGAGYFSVVTVDGERHYLGRFSSAAEAREAYSAAKARLHPYQDAGNLAA